MSESIDLEVDNGVLGVTEAEPERTPVDRGAELQEVMESLADWLDNYGEAWQDVDGDQEHVPAVAQILELTQMLLAEHQMLVHQMNSFIGAMAIAKEEATRGTKLIVANAGEAAKLIRGE